MISSKNFLNSSKIIVFFDGIFFQEKVPFKSSYYIVIVPDLLIIW